VETGGNRLLIDRERIPWQVGNQPVVRGYGGDTRECEKEKSIGAEGIRGCRRIERNVVDMDEGDHRHNNE
jgi:hypothetical protein